MVLTLSELADGFSVYTSGEGEAKLVYHEIFIDECYDVAKLSEAPFIVDAGANIGLTCIYMKRKYPAAKILAFEPAPENFDALRKNLEYHDVADGVVTYQQGLGTKATEAKITYFPTSPANSTFYPETKELQISACTQVLGPELTDQFYGGQQVISVPVNRLSHFLNTDHPQVEKIDLLKVDVEGAEIDVIKGIDDDHWVKIQNVVVEAANRKGDVEEIEGILKSKGFEVTTTTNTVKMDEMEKMLEQWGFKYNHIENADELYKELLLSLVVGRRTTISQSN